MNWKEKDIEKAKMIEGLRFIEWGKELCPSTQTPHLHLYILFHNAIGLKGANHRIHKQIKRAADIGTCDDGWRAYVCKQGDVGRWGDEPAQGRRTDLDQVKELINSGANMRTIVNNARSYQSVRMAEIYLKYNEPSRRWLPKVWWFWGGTGSGKSREAHEHFNYECYSPVSFKWWEGYDGHENIILDEIRGDFCKYHELLKLLDRYPYRVECKGGSRQLLAKHIIITSCYPPDKLYTTVEDVNQLLRRLTEVRHFTGTEVE